MTAADAYPSSARRKQLEAEVLEHRLAAARLCRQINAGTYVVRLPDELLVDILSIYIDISLQANQSQFPEFGWGQPYSWIRVTHVCHHLRTVALNTPSLWTNIAVTCPEPVKASIARSGNMPLQVVLDENTNKTEDVMSLWDPIFRTALRVHSLCIRLRRDWQPNFPTDVPAFTALRILKLDYSLSRGRSWDHLPPFIPHHLPHLHTLYACWVPYASIQPLLLPSLRSLSLYNVRMPDSGGWQPFLEALRGMPTLEDLTIHKCLFPLPPDYLHLPLLVDRVVTLPALRLLQVSCHVTVAGAALLLRNLCFPGDVRVEIGETGWSEVEVSSQIGLGGHAEEEVAGCVLSALQYRLSGHDGLADPPPQLMSLHLDVQDGDELSFKGWSSILPDASPGSIASHEMQSALRFDVSCWPGGNMAEYFMDRLSLAPSLFGVRTIAISCSPYEVDVVLPTDTLASGFARLPEVQTVLVSGSPAVGPILTALRTPCGPEKRLPCPSLKTLHISGFSFARERADYELADHPMDYVVEHKNGFECIKRMITARYQQGFPIDSLIVSDCEVSQVEWIEQLSKLVRVVWDGNTSRAASEEPQPL